jgi:tetratricopeptide (TPR) repeat protein
LGLCLVLTLGVVSALSATVPAREPVSPLLELEAEVPLGDVGVGLAIAATPAGELYLSDESRGGIRQRDADGTAWRPLIAADPGPKLPRHPTAIATDAAGQLWVADADRRRVVVIGPAGEPVQTYEDGRRLLRKPTRLARLADGRMTAWDSEGSALVKFGSESDPLAPAIALLSSHPGADFCLPADHGIAYCVAADRKTLTRQANGKTLATWTPPGPYPRIGDLALTPTGDLYLTDTAGRRLYLLTQDLGTATRLRVYESLFQSPTQLALVSGRLWLLDEGRKSVLKFRPRTAETAWEHTLLGEEYLTLGLYESALHELEAGQRLGLDRPDLMLNIGSARYGLGQFAAAIAAWDALPREVRDQPAAGLRRANAQFRLGHHRPAADGYAAIPPTAAEYQAARFNLAQAHLAMGEYEPACATLADLLTAKPDNPPVRLALARALIGLGRAQEAATLLEPLTKPGPVAGLMAGEAAYLLGHQRLAAGDAQEALPLLEQAASLGPNYRAALTDLAQAYRQLGDAERARFYAQRAADLGTDADHLASLILEDAP